MTIEHNGASVAPYAQPITREALANLQIIEANFEEHPVMYCRFFGYHARLQNQQVSALEVIKRVYLLFTGHPTHSRLHMFSSKGHRIHCCIECRNSTCSVTATTPVGIVIDVSGCGAIPNPRA